MPDEKTWSMDDERSLMENLVLQRFNFFMVVFAVIVGGAFQVDSWLKRASIFSIGTLISLLFLGYVYRAYAKSCILLEDLPDGHPYQVAHDRVDAWFLKGGKNWPIFKSIWIAVVCWLVLAALTVMTILGVFEP